MREGRGAGSQIEMGREGGVNCYDLGSERACNII